MSELSSAPVQVLPWTNPTPRKGIPLLMEFPVNPHLSPILVTSSRSLLWVRPRGELVRAALRDVPEIFDFFLEVVREVTTRGREAEWGNVAPLTTAGLAEAIAHVKSYGLDQLEILANPEFPWGNLSPEWAPEPGTLVLAVLGLPVQPSPWLPVDTLVVLPKDREYVGFALLYEHRLASVIHNAPRGMGLVTSWVPPEPEPAKRTL